MSKHDLDPLGWNLPMLNDRCLDRLMQDMYWHGDCREDPVIIFYPAQVEEGVPRLSELRRIDEILIWRGESGTARAGICERDTAIMLRLKYTGTAMVLDPYELYDGVKALTEGPGTYMTALSTIARERGVRP